MPLGPGKYDDLATFCRETAKADGVIVVVFGGPLGDGFAMQAPLDITLGTPLFLRQLADEIEKSHKGGKL